ncbi:hypothetical protein [Parasitella parasitica]|uniref:Sorting nexin MVP1 n=1 Tax=Parasitella parasitica TaxID=35722 RepID=A0A0B7N241_9FUNG|nr:hypothetical protein [Parasitella parasitica]
MSEDIAGSSFLGENNYFLPESRTMSFAVEEDPWSAAGFDPVDDMRQPLTQSETMDEELVTEGITPANVLVGVDLPEVFDTAYIRAGPVGDRVSVEALGVIIGLGGLGPRLFEQIALITVPSNAMYVTRNEFNTALALLGFAQKNMDLPIPSLSNLDNVSIKRSNPIMASNTKSKRRQSFDDDPWRIGVSPPTASNGFPYQANDSIDAAIAARNTNDATPTVVNSTNGLDNENQTSDNDTSSAATTAKSSAMPKRFVPAEVITDKVSTQALVKASTESYQWFLDLDQIAVTVAEKEGFLFTHINYWVHSTQRQTSVRRRYSDFYWFWETLLKRYPFRVIPNLPPKKISGKDKVFLEKRCQGLSRFINCIVRHPVLKNDEQVITFLTEQTEFSAWRRAKSPNLDEEFERVNPQTEELEAFIPKDLDSRIELIKNKLPSAIEKYDALCSVMEKTIRLKEAQAIEMKLYNDTLKELSEAEHQCFVPNCDACAQVVRGYENVGNYLAKGSTIIEAETASAIAGVLENLKRHRDISSSFLEMLDRRFRLDANQINALYKKISANTAKVNQNRGVPGLESEVERLDTIIKADTEKMIYQQRRDTYVRYCLASELSYLHKQQAFVSLLYQNYVHEQLQYARRTIDNWKALEALLCEMPKPEDFS